MSPFQHNTAAAKSNKAGGLLASVFLHIFAIVILGNLRSNVREDLPLTSDASNSAPIYIDMRALKDLKILRALPVIQPSGRGGKPGTSGRLPEDVLQASTVKHPTLTMIVNPVRPENNRQAIHQEASPPDLKIQVEQAVPDIVLVDGPAAPKPRVDLDIRRPMDRESPLGATAVTAPAIASNAPELPMKIISSVQQPRMPLSYFANGSLHAPRGGVPPNGQQSPAAANTSMDASGGIVAVSVDPATFSQLAALAQGNRYGALAIAPVKEGAGSPGGGPSGASAAGTAGTGKGGDLSSGVGLGHSGGGGADEVGIANLSAVGGAGRSGGVDANRMLSPVPPSTVYAVTLDPKIRRAPLVISAGPMGGGGLDVYGALPCGKVYSIFLPMPGKNWVLQYCTSEVRPAAAKPAPTSGGVVRLEAGLIPPSADKQFDFRRLPVPEKDADKLIVLRASVGKDGSVHDVQAYRGVLAEMDAEAAVAFSHWKFKPATRAGDPIEVEVLVGVPVRLPEKTNEAFGGGVKSHE